MACVDFLSQVDTANDDPFANWVKFDEDTTAAASQQLMFNAPVHQKATRHHEKKRSDDLLDIFEFLKQSRQDDDNKDDEKYILPKPKQKKKDVNLLDFSNVPDFAPAALPHPAYSAKAVARSHSTSTVVAKPLKQTNAAYLTLNIAGLRGSISMNSTKRINIDKEDHILSELRTDLTANSRVSDLRKFIKTQYKIKPTAELLIVYAHYVLSNARETLKSYGICNNACLFVLICEDAPKFNSFCSEIEHLGLTAGELEYHSFERSQTSMLNLLNTTYPTFECKTISDLDILSYEVCTKCIEMPCGHGMPPDTLYLYAQSELTSKATTFVKCPHLNKADNSNHDDDGHAIDFFEAEKDGKCDRMWHYPVIRKVLVQSKQFKPADLVKLELLHSLNVLKKYYMVSECPSCRHCVYRHMADDRNRRYTACPSCNTRFCFKCKQEWQDTKSLVYCGHEECCNFEREHYEILKECEPKTIGSVSGVPSIRECPKCSQLINHTSACKHIECSLCKEKFCFVCLKRMVNGAWQCGSSGDVCPIAARQSEKALEPPPRLQRNKGKQKLAQVSEWGDWYQ